MFGVQNDNHNINISNNAQHVNIRNSPTIFELIKKRLEKNSDYIEISIKIPVLKKEVYEMLSDMHENINDDILTILVEKYLNLEELKNQIEEKIKLFYKKELSSNDIIFYDTESIINKY